MDKCKKCGAELKENQKFCSECGTPVNQKCVCRKCGIELEPETKFCPECGTNQSVSASFSESFTTLQKINFEKVSKEFYTSENWERLLSLITPVYEKHPENEEVLYYYLQILIESDPEAAKDAVSSLNDELFEVCCAKFDIAIKENNLPKAENILEKAELKWNDNKILKYKRALFLLTLGAKEENDDCIADALALLASMENPADKREKRENAKSFNLIKDKNLYDLEFVPELIKKIAEQGDSTAQILLGGMYEGGYGVEKDYEEAEKWFRKSAEQGDDRGQVDLGNMYLNGTGVEKNYAEAVKWYRKSAEHGNFNAMELLGSMFEQGKGVEQDYEEAVKWYKKAAEKGHPDEPKEALERLADQGIWEAKKALEDLENS